MMRLVFIPPEKIEMVQFGQPIVRNRKRLCLCWGQMGETDHRHLIHPDPLSCEEPCVPRNNPICAV